MSRPTKQAPGGRVPKPMLPPRQLPPPDPTLRERALAGLILGMLSVMGVLFAGNVRRSVLVVSVTLLLACVAIWLGATASKRARRGGTARPRGSVLGVVFGCAGLAASASWLLALAVFWPQLTTYSDCMAAANTLSAQQTCRTQLSNSVGNEISVLRGTG